MKDWLLKLEGKRQKGADGARRRENRIMIYLEETKVKSSREEGMGGATEDVCVCVCSDNADHMTVCSTPSASFM